MLRPRLFRVTVILFLAIFFHMAAPPLSAQRGKVPATPSAGSDIFLSADFDETDRRAEVSFHNNGERDLTAWYLKVVIRFEDGEEIVRHPYSDTMLLGGGDRERSGIYLKGGGSRTIQIPLSDTQTKPVAEPPVEASILAAIYTDGTVEGNSDLINLLLVERRAYLDQLEAEVRVLDQLVAESGELLGKSLDTGDFEEQVGKRLKVPIRFDAELEPFAYVSASYAQKRVENAVMAAWNNSRSPGERTTGVRHVRNQFVEDVARLKSAFPNDSLSETLPRISSMPEILRGPRCKQ